MAKTQRAVALTIAGRTRLRTPPLSGTIFTFGCLLLASGPVRMAVLVVPVLWSAVGGSAASCWRCRRDWALLAASARVSSLAARMASGGRPLRGAPLREVLE